MLAKFGKTSGLAILALFLVFCLTAPAPLMAQFFNDEFENDDFIESDEEFMEDGGDGFDVPIDADDFSEGGRFIDEEREIGLPGGGVTIRGRENQLRLQGEREMLPLNSAWGAGTGLLIGGWFALIENGDNRTTQRSIGLGIVLGTMLGVFLGMKTLVLPNSPRAAMSDPPLFEDQKPLVSQTSEALSFSFSLKF